MSKQHQGDIQLQGTGRESIITYNNEHRPPNAAMILAESQVTPPTTTDQHYHSETIWRVILDIISLLICKADIFSEK
jgi:hypothetical protein